jgi:hypothetical protein
MSYNTGSVISEVGKLIEDIPSSLSGTSMSNLIDRSITRFNNYTGKSVSSANINDSYAPAIINLTAAELLGAMELIGADVAQIKLGDFSESKGQASNTSKAQDYFLSQAEKDMKYIGRDIKYDRTW